MSAGPKIFLLVLKAERRSFLLRSYVKCSAYFEVLYLSLKADYLLKYSLRRVFIVELSLIQLPKKTAFLFV